MCNVRSKIARNDNIADLIIFVRCFFIWKTGCISNVITENFCGKGKEIRVGKTGLKASVVGGYEAMKKISKNYFKNRENM